MSWFIYAGLCALLVSLAALVEKRVLRNEHSLEFATLLSLIIAVLSIPVLFSGTFPAISLQWLGILYVASILSSLAYVLLTKAIKHLDISFVSPFLLLGPVLSTFSAYVFIGEKITAFQGWGIALILLGGFLLEKKEFNFNPGKSKYVLLILAALALYSITVLVDKTVVSTTDIPIAQYLALMQIFVAINILIIRFIHQRNTYSLFAGFKKYGPAVLIVALLTYGYRYFQLNAIALVSVGVVAAMKHSSSLLTAILGGEFFHEKNVPGKVLATILMFGGVVLVLLG